MTRTTEPTSTPPMSTGRSYWPNARSVSTPRPGRPKILSVKIAPVSWKARSRPKIVATGVTAARRPCL